MVSLSGTVSAGFQRHWLMSSGSFEPPVVKILGGFSEPMHVRVFEPPADPEPPPGTVQSPFSVFQSAMALVGLSNTSPSSSNTTVGATAHATEAVARIAVAPRGAKNRLELELKYRTNARMVRIAFPPFRFPSSPRGDVSHFGQRNTIGSRHEIRGAMIFRINTGPLTWIGIKYEARHLTASEVSGRTIFVI